MITPPPQLSKDFFSNQKRDMDAARAIKVAESTDKKIKKLLKAMSRSVKLSERAVEEAQKSSRASAKVAWIAVVISGLSLLTTLFNVFGVGSNQGTTTVVISGEACTVWRSVQAE